MITNIFINALGQAIFESCGQALLIYVVLQLAMQLFPALSSKYRYDINYLGLTIITCWFVANLVNIYMHNAELAKYSILLYSSHINYGTKNIPTLLQQTEGFISTYAKYITGLYMMGLILQAFKLIGGFVHIHQIRKQKNLFADSFWTTKADALSQKLKIVKKVALHFSAQVDVPLTIGYLKPIIIFPVALINNLDTEQVEAILMHELAHIKRYDYLLNILQCIMETMLCFNPFVWLISKTIRQEREYCCDDMVMEEDYNNFTYSKALFIIAQQNHQNYALAMASAGKNKYPLLKRIKRLNTMKTNDSLSKTHLLIIIAIAAIGGLLVWGIPQYSMAKTASHKKIKINANPKMQYGSNKTGAVSKSTIALLNGPKPTGQHLNDTASNTTALVDTSKNHAAKFKIVIEDDKGNKKEYNSVKELPDSEKQEFVKENPSFSPMQFKWNDSLKQFKMDPAIKAQILAMKIDAEKLNKQFKNNPKWNAQVLDMKIEAERIDKKVNSPEWKKQVEDMKLQAEKMNSEANSPEFKKQVEDMKIQAQKMAEQANNPEFKKQIKDMKVQAEKIAEKYTNNPEFQKQIKLMKIDAEKLSKEANSPEFKKQIKDIQKQAIEISKQFDSPEWKKQMEDMQQQIKIEVEDQIKATQDSVKTAN
jgi:bla regulator protein BlaR1